MRRVRVYSSSRSQIILVYLYPSRRNSFFAAENRKKIIKTPIFKVQGHSRSSMFTFLRSSLPVLIKISSMSVPICKRFYAKPANSGKITTFGSTLLWHPRAHCAGLLESRTLWLTRLKSTFNGENFIRRLSRSIPSHFGAIHSWNVCCNAKSRKIHQNPRFWGFKVIQSRRC